MKLIMNAINGEYLQNIMYKLDLAEKPEEVLAAVAYATDARLLFDWCWKNKVPLKYYGRLDAGVAVNINVLNSFFNKKSANFVCKLVEHHHAKVIWWRGFGLYIGSANLTTSAWNKNVESGCFFSEKDNEIDDDMASDIQDLFDTLEENSRPLTQEVIDAMQKRSTDLAMVESDATEFWNNTSFKRWRGLVTAAKEKPQDRKREEFLKEWYDTLEYLRDIGKRVSQPENRPVWINDRVPAGTQADQFLHAHYYERTFDGRKANYNLFFEENKTRREEALAEAIRWWRDLSEAPDKEDIMLNETAPFLQEALLQEALVEMDEVAFREVCRRIHATLNYALRAPNKSVNLPDGTTYDSSQKIEALAKTIWNDQSSAGERVKGLIGFILYGGTNEQLPERLWQGVTDPKWKISGLGISSLGEMVGWARPNTFPPRNGRTSKALKSLGYNVKVHVG